MSHSDITSDDVRDGFQRVRWWDVPLPFLFYGSLRWSQHALVLGGQSLGLRIVWMLLPVPFLVLSIWSIIARERRKSELERHMSRAAAEKALLVTFAGLVLLGQVDTTFALAGSGWRYRDLWLLPLFVWVVFSMREFRRYTRR